MLTNRRSYAIAICSLALLSVAVTGCQTKGVSANSEWTTAIDKGAAWQTEFASRMNDKAKAAEAGTLSEADKTTALRFAADGAKIQADQWTKIQQGIHGIYPSETTTSSATTQSSQ